MVAPHQNLGSTKKGLAILTRGGKLEPRQHARARESLHMAKRTTTLEPGQAHLSQQQIIEAIPKIERRLRELRDINVDALNEQTGDDELESVTRKTNATLRDIFGPNTIEYKEYEIDGLSCFPMVFTVDTDTSFRARCSVPRCGEAGLT